ncbi:MAG: hypothetical protein Q9160_005536 [Pyrenula sp. 1 TL-2023]
MASTQLTPERRKAVLRVLFISLLLDLISFTFILPLFPSLLTFYRTLDSSPTSLLNRILHYLNAYKRSFSLPTSPTYDVVLLGGALGSLFSLLQALASPLIGRFSDTHGRRTALLLSMAGNIASVALWCAATDFRTFLASRVVAGLSEGNVQLATAIAADISDEGQRGSTMALVGACFSVAFTFGPALGAALAGITTVKANPFATAAGVSLLLVVTETVYLYLYLPETNPTATSTSPSSPPPSKQPPSKSSKTTPEPPSTTTSKTNIPLLLNTTHLLFLLPFSGLEFSLPFLITSTVFPNSPSPQSLSGRLLGFIGLIASLLQGTIIRRLPPLLTIRLGVLACILAFFILAAIPQGATGTMYLAAGCLAVTSATVVTGLNALGSLTREARGGRRGEVLGALRSWGQLGRAMGPVVFCSLFWWAGREVAYVVGGMWMVGVAGLVFGVLREPRIESGEKKSQ